MEKTKRKFNLKVIILAILSALFINIGLSVSTAFAAENDSNEQTVLAKDILSSVTYDKNTNNYVMNTNKLQKETALSKEQAIKLSIAFNKLSSNQQKKLVEDVSDNKTPYIAPLIIWAAEVLGGWLATKLLDWGASKFCANYRNYNGVTKTVCNIIS